MRPSKVYHWSFPLYFQIVGVALLSMGTIFFTQELQTSLDEDATALSVETNDALRALKLGALFFLVKGIVGILLAILGCWGAIKESPLLMKVVSKLHFINIHKPLNLSSKIAFYILRLASQFNVQNAAAYNKVSHRYVLAIRSTHWCILSKAQLHCFNRSCLVLS